jgi:serine/threonine protein kinase
MSSQYVSLYARKQRLEEIIFSYERALDAGEPLDRQELLNLHAELANELRSYFADLDRFHLSPLSTSADLDALLVKSFGDYEVIEEIDRGGMGVVLRVRDKKLVRDLAFKIMRPEHKDDPALVRRFLKEAEICGRLQHPGIVPVHERGHLPDGPPYFTMRLVEGKTLASLLKGRSAAEDLPHFLAVFDQICQAMAYAHSQNVIHRDLKPANIMVGIHGDVQVMDWGLAKVLGEEGANSVLRHPSPECEGNGIEAAGSGSANKQSHTGEVMGTLPYMAPEQAQGKVNQLDARCDVFSLGAILCEILTGRPPYVGGDLLARAQAGDVTDALICLDACGADKKLIHLAMHCLLSKPDNRPQNAGEVARQLLEYLDYLNQSPQKDAEEKVKAAEAKFTVAQNQVVAATARAAAAERRLKTAHKWLKGAAATLLITFGMLAWTGLRNSVETSANPAPAFRAAANQGQATPASSGYSASNPQGDRRDKEKPVLSGDYASATSPHWPQYGGPLYAPAFSELSGAAPQHTAGPFGAVPGILTHHDPVGTAVFPGVSTTLADTHFSDRLGAMYSGPPMTAPDMSLLLNASRYSESVRSAEFLMSRSRVTSFPPIELPATKFITRVRVP